MKCIVVCFRCEGNLPFTKLRSEIMAVSDIAFASEIEDAMLYFCILFLYCIVCLYSLKAY